MKLSDFKCTQGGFCCELWGGNLHATRRDIAYWKDHKPELLNYVNQKTGALWLNPDGGMVSRCPWLSYDNEGLASCSIYPYRPEVCMQYPNSEYEANSICSNCRKIKNPDTRHVKINEIIRDHDFKQDHTHQHPIID